MKASAQVSFAEICARRGLPQPVEIRRLSGGSANLNVVARFGDATPPVKITVCLYKDLAGARRVAQLLDALADAPVGRLVGRPDDVRLEAVRLDDLPFAGVRLDGPRPVLVTRFTEGTPLATVDPPTAAEIGRLLARLHRPPPAVAPAHDMGPARLAALAGGHDIDGAPIGDAAFVAFVADALSAAAGDDGLPLALIHGDLFPDNLIRRPDGRLVAIDFEEACRAPRAFDLAMCAVGFAGADGPAPEAVAALVRAYAAEAGLLPVERAALPGLFVRAAVAVAAWRRIGTPDEVADSGRDWRDMRPLVARARRWTAEGVWARILEPTARSPRTSNRRAPAHGAAMQPSAAAILDALGLAADNPGAALGGDTWRGGGEALTSFDPSTGAPIATVRCADADDHAAVMQAALDAAAAWRRVPAPRRGEAVRLVGEALRRHKDDLGRLVSLEVGKILEEGRGEVQEMIDLADFAVGQSRMLYGRTMHSERPEHRMYEQYHPLGVVAVITAFNFPVAVWAWNALIAAVCGNATIWKPSPKAPLCALAVQRICDGALTAGGFPPIFFTLVDGDAARAKALAADPRVPLVSFTGSTAVGKQVAQTVAGRLGRSLLELGGNNALIVDETADLELALPAIVFGAVGTAGQRCTTTRRLLIHRSRYAEVVEKVAHAYGQVRVGAPLDPQTLLGPLIDATAVARFEQTVARIEALGGRVLAGGAAIDRPGFYVQPTLVEARPEWDVVAEETFAPIAYAMPFDEIDEAIALNNGVAQGLSSALFTADLRRAERFLGSEGSDCGIANVNIGTSGAEIGGAFGGEKDTGGGREAGSDAWKAYMRRQTNTINHGRRLPLAQGIKFEL